MMLSPGKALCFLSKTDLAERCSGAGDVIHNILQMLLRETSCFTPSSPLTPRAPGLMTPTSPSPFGSHWPLLNSSASETFPNLSHLISQTNSVTLSPAPSVDSVNGGSPKQEGAVAVPPLYIPPHLQIPQNLTSGESPAPAAGTCWCHIRVGGARDFETPTVKFITIIAFGCVVWISSFR